jgi:endonuclease/exonuclease/phosphatase family metal-dependent hydrolase
VRVLTLNLLDRQQADGPSRRAVARRALRELRPDVVALQEVTRTVDLDEAADLLGPDYAVVDHPGAVDGVGACLAARRPMGEPRVLRLPSADGLPWAATVVVEVEAPDGPILVAHHKPSWQRDREREREVQAVAAARFVEEVLDGRSALPVVLLGDLDAGPDSACVRFLTGRQSLDGTSVRYEDAWEAVHPDDPGHTFTPRNPLVRAGEMPLERGRRIDRFAIVAPCLSVDITVGLGWDSRRATRPPTVDQPSRPSRACDCRPAGGFRCPGTTKARSPANQVTGPSCVGRASGARRRRGPW